MRALGQSPSGLPPHDSEEIPVVLPVKPTSPVAELPTLLPLDEIPTVEQVPFALPVPEAANGDEVPVAELAPQPPRGFFGFLWHVGQRIGSAWEWCFGIVALMIGLAVLAAIPLVQFLTLGYLLEASGRVAKTGKLQSGLIGVRSAARLGGFVLGTWLMVLPLRLVSSMWTSAQLIDPDGTAATGWKITLIVLTVLMLIHIAMAWACGGRLRHFLVPFANPLRVAWYIWRGGFWSQSRDGVWNFAKSLRLHYYFWLGFRGFLGAFLWLAVPITMLAVGRKVPLIGFLGALVLIWVLLLVPFLQLHFVVQNRFGAFLEVFEVRRHFRRAPIAFAFAFFITLLFAVPLYLLKIEMIPREAAWLPTLVFIAFIFPARLLSGWAFGRSLRRQKPRNFVFRWTARFTMLAVTLLYVVIVYFSQYAAWEGIWSLYEQHAFLLPVPFLGM